MFTALTESKHHLLQKMVGTTDRPASKQLEVHSDLLIKKDKKRGQYDFNVLCILQTLSEVEDSLRELEQKVTELRSKAEGLRSEQTSNQELLKLQVNLSLCFLFHLHRFLRFNNLVCFLRMPMRSWCSWWAPGAAA